MTFEDEYRAYRDVIAAGIRSLRPRAEVATVGLNALDLAIERLDPQVVVCSRPYTADPGGGLAWVEVSLDPTRPTKVWFGGRRWESTEPTLDLLLVVIDEAERLARTNEE